LDIITFPGEIRSILTLGLSIQKDLEREQEWQRTLDNARNVTKLGEIREMYRVCKHFVNFGDEESLHDVPY
jgi:hypothetical protein